MISRLSGSSCEYGVSVTGSCITKLKDPSCSNSPVNESVGAVTIQRSLWSVQASVTCHDDYFPSTLQVTCAADGKWSEVQCLKRVWRYPETMEEGFERQVFQIPGTVTVGWSVCVQGMPTAITNFALEIRDTSYTILLHTSWRLHFDEPTPYLMLISFDGGWWSETRVGLPPLLLQVGQQFDFKLTANTSSTVHIFMNHQFLSGWTLSVPLSTFYYISGGGDVNLTKVETWCSG
ncbi:uncharacterized protein LOC112573655 [Pomacea canaliculata]|uniref:uncharacterized protein LOC112573655 n=1 Tax=Pomacea canaliculata TaxID=400727 RepID=UPI000D73D197|nr:uncharacterized protein LOC112573655 [Pomacea canaliculata]